MSWGVVLILWPPHTAHITQGEDVINFVNLKGAIRKQTAKALHQKFHKLAPYNDPLA